MNRLYETTIIAYNEKKNKEVITNKTHENLALAIRDITTYKKKDHIVLEYKITTKPTLF